MPEITVADVELFTRGGLLATDVETNRILQRAYSAVRKYCGWHVSPELATVTTLDGPGHTLLALPTLKLVTLTSVVEDGVTLTVGNLTPSASGRLLVKRVAPYLWSANYRSIVVTMTHGFASAPDFDQAVLSLISEMASMATASVGQVGSVKRNKVDDTEREWFASAAAEEAFAATIGSMSGLLEQYRLIPQI